MGTPLEEASWNAVTGAYYTGHGSGEALWLLVSMGLCVLALIMGALHERHAYKQSQKR